MTDTINHIKTELMPDYDYDEYTRRHEEYEARRAAGEFDNPPPKTPAPPAEAEEEAQTPEPPQSVDAPLDDIIAEDTKDAADIDEDDMKW